VALNTTLSISKRLIQRLIPGETEPREASVRAGPRPLRHRHEAVPAPKVSSSNAVSSPASAFFMVADPSLSPDGLPKWYHDGDGKGMGQTPPHRR
jgi:hypothetical protein